MLEVKKPQSITLRNSWRMRSWLNNRKSPRIDWGMAPATVTADEAIKVSRWLLEYSKWARSLEPEHDERND